MAEEPPESSSRRTTRTLGLSGARSAAPFISSSLLERPVRRSGAPPSNPARRVGLMRPHGSYLVGGSGSPFSFPSAGDASGSGSGSGGGHGSGSGGGQASGSGGGHASGSGGGQASGSGGGHASGSGGGQASGSGGGQPRTRGPCRLRRQQTRANNVAPVAVDLPLSFGGGFCVDMDSSFFNTRENVEQGSGRDTGINLNGPPSDTALPQGYLGIGYNPNFENADEYPPSQTPVQAPNSPDCNILDLGWFASIQSMFQKKMPKTLAEIVEKVNQSLAEYPHQKLNRIFLSHQACMREIIKKKGSIHYDVPHLKKQALERQGKLPIRLTVEKQLIEDALALAWLNAN